MAPKNKKRKVTKLSGGGEGAVAPSQKKRKVSNSSGEEEGVVAPKKKTFFDLPPELRNDIYELVLIDGEVVVHESLKQPGLLQTCRQIRSETIKVWYYRPSFKSVVVDCDARLLGKWTRHTAKYDNEEDSPVDWVIVLTGQPNWENLTEWCREVHSRRCVSVYPKTRDREYLHAIYAALEIANNFRNAPWTQVEQTLNTLRHTLGCIDEGWLDGFEESDEKEEV
ncbi:hypothetical protein M409DRAFT_25936 [Zasmidium cellare ATCC 36951]|uniref:Uncharacterized protein n=1 Tax=Zasmidium cellare ATCC 36951 TaxID=1080233 RepID=A0A6A6CCV6_ZASCE|nr:uncharacterized protein M409DRAFT_25936 [Zasmidium cellare ATCC 36951]KAF2163752.1 hypothetical protein M409DRAFT_25936 [Zasmidium cellare ATCC 36951]